MNSQSSGSLGEGIVYQGTLPLGWRVLSDPPTSAQLVQWDVANERVLQLVSAFEEYTPEIGDDHGGQSHELAHLDFKLNLVLELVGQLLSAQLHLPDACPVRLNAQGVEWRCAAGDPPPPGTILLVSIYLNTSVPRPLELVGRVGNVAQSPEGTHVYMEFQEFSDSVRDSLEKLIFRHHRRAVAHTRLPRNRD